MKDRAAKIPPAAKIRLAEAIRRLLDLYTACEKPEEAAKWQKKLDELDAAAEEKPSASRTRSDGDDAPGDSKK